MIIYKIILVVCILIIIVGTGISHLKKEYWLIRAFDFPRLQIISLGIIFLGAYYFAWEGSMFDYVICGLLIIAIFDHFFRILPYTPFYPKEVITCKDPDGHPCFRLVVMNVLMYNRNTKKAMEILQATHPDIIIGLETDEWWVEQLEQLHGEYPYRVEVPKDNTYGMILLSKFKLENTSVEYLLSEEVPSIHTKIVLPGNNYFRLYAVHPKPPFLGHSANSTKRDAELIMVGKKTREVEEPIIVAGDLNDVAWSFTTHLFQKFSELLDPRKGRGMFNTFHAKYFLLRFPLDHVFHSDEFQVIQIKRLPFFDSDHFPIMIELCLKPSESYKQDEPEADEEEVELAEDKVLRAKMDMEN